MDDGTRSNEMRPAPTFLYPHARDYGFDEVCEKIVRALEKRHFDVPGIDVQISTYGSGEQRMRAVRRITGKEFSLGFSRGQGLLPEGVFIDTAAVCDVAIQGEKISVYEDHSGPSYHVYVGEDWDQDRSNFFGSCVFVNSKLRGEPRIYLTYKGSDELNRRVRYKYLEKGGYEEAATYLLHDNDIGREYELADGDEPFYKTSEVVARMTARLEKELFKIETIPERKADYHFEEEADIPVEACPELWTHVDRRTTSRIESGKSDLDSLPLARRFALTPGYRLLAYGVSSDGLDIDGGILHNGYVWSSMNPEEIPNESRLSIHFGKTHLVRITPTRANDIYVIDEAAYDHCRAVLGDKIEKEGRDRFSNSEIGDMKRARAKTLTPLNSYQGGFEKPVVIIGRELGFDEVQLIQDESES